MNQQLDEEIKGEVPNEGPLVLLDLGARHNGMWKRSGSPVSQLSEKGPTTCRLGFYGGFITQSRLTKSLAIGSNSTSSPSPLPWLGSKITSLT